jgi:tricorn protease
MARWLNFPVFLFAIFIGAGFAQSRAQAEAPNPDRPLWIRSPAISPDARNITFTYRGQIWLAQSEGGEAVALTEREYHSTHPVWSPDGRHIAFASNRYNESSVFVAPVDGGEIRRLTFHSLPEFPVGFTPDGKDVIVSAARTGTKDVNFFDGLRGRFNGQLYTVPVEGGRERLLMPLPATAASMSPDGKTLAYAFNRSIEVEWRKGQISDGTSDIWIFDRASKKHRQLTTHRGNDREPVFSAEGAQVYFLSEMPKSGAKDPNARPGTFNVWRQAASGETPPEQLTFHDTLPVRGLSVAANGTVVYGFDGEVWRLDPKAKEPRRVAIRIRQGTLFSGPVVVNLNDQVSEITVSPSEEELAIVARGDIFVVSAKAGRTRRITVTPEAERSVRFSPDGRKLLYAAEREGKWELFVTRIVRDSDKTFIDAAELAETLVLTDEKDLLQPVWSPKGDRIAFRHDRNALRVLTLATGKVDEVLPDKASYSFSEGDLSHEWSPDGRYLVTTSGFSLGNPEVVVIDTASPNFERYNVSRSGFSDEAPRFSRDGRLLYWLSDRFGARALDGKSVGQDVIGTFLFPLDKAAYGAGGTLAAEHGGIDFARVDQRTVRMTGFSQPLLFSDLSADNRRLTVVAKANRDAIVYAFNPRSGAARQLFERPYNEHDQYATTSNGDTLFIAGPRGIDRYDLAKGGEMHVSFDTTSTHDRHREMVYIFEHQWRFVGQKFYDPKMHGVDWQAMHDRYARYLPHITHWSDFADLMGELQGELNASHMFSRYNAVRPTWDQTASLGLWYDTTYEGEGFRVEGVMPGGPTDFPGSLVTPGTVILAVDGKTVTAAMDIWPLLDRLAGKKVRLSLLQPGSSKQVEQVVTAVWDFFEEECTYGRWVEEKRALVERLSGGRLGYVHVAGMNNVEMQKVYSELMGRYRDSEGAVIDVRFNVGGLLHDQLIAFLGGERHSGIVTRNGVDLGTSPYTRWAKPTAAVANAFSYSDGSVFPSYYMREKIGPMVGDRVPGTGTAVYDTQQIEPRLYFGIAQIGFRTKDGEFFENHEVKPTEMVPTEPNFITEGRDPQLERAVELLLARLQKK